MSNADWKTPGALFTIPLNDGTFGLGQVIQPAPGALNSVFVCIFSYRLTEVTPATLPAVTRSHLLASHFTTPDLFKNRKWRVLQTAPHLLTNNELQELNAVNSRGFVGVKVIGSGILTSLLRAWHGLEPWDRWHDPNYLDKLLHPGQKRPANAVLSKSDQPGGPT